MTSAVTPAYDKDASHGSQSGTMPHLLPCTATVPGPASPFSSDPPTKNSPTSTVSLPCGSGHTSPLQQFPIVSDSQGHGNAVPERHAPSPARRSSSIHQTCSGECSSGNSESCQNRNDSSSCCCSTEGDTSISNNKNVSWINGKRKTCSVSQSERQPDRTSPNSNLKCASGSTSTTNVVRNGTTSGSGSKESTTKNTNNPDDTERTATTTGGSSMQFGGTKHWNASAWAPVTSSSSDGSSGENGYSQFFRADGTISEQHVRELRLLCRLIGLHSRPRLQKGQRINVYLHGSGMTAGKGGGAPGAASTVANIGGGCGAAATCNLGLGFSQSLFLKRTGSYENPLGLSPSEEIKVLGGVDIGANTKCLFFVNDNEDHLYICFNWFDPQSVLDVVSLSCRLASSFRLHPTEKSSSFNEDTTLDQLPFLEAARRSALAFWNHPEFQELLQDGGAILRPSSRSAGCNAGSGHQDQPLMQNVYRRPFRRASFSSNLQAITCGGFSIGGPTAFYVASLLSVHISPDAPIGPNVRQRIRAVAFGSPRFCGEKFVRWCGQHLAASSCTVILYSTAQHTQQQEPREQLQEQLQKHQHAWDGSTVKPSLTAAGASKNQDGKITTEQRMILDPVCVQGSADDGFVMQPNTVLLRVGGGLMRMGKQHEEEAATAAEEVTLNSSSIMWNMATRVSPFTKVYNERYAMLHSVLRYYEALADT